MWIPEKSQENGQYIYWQEFNSGLNAALVF